MASGLDKITNAPQIKIDQRTEWIECLPCCEQKNQYSIYNTNETFEEQGDQIGNVEEKDPGLCCLFCCKALRKYDTEFEINNYTVATSARPFKCAIANTCNCFTCLECCQQEVNVFQGDQKIGSIKWPYSCFCNPNRGKMSCCELDVRDANDNIIYKITANATQLPFIVQCFCQFSFGCIQSLSRKEYSIIDTKGDVVGSITNIYNDLLLECCTRADKFAVKFPSDADINKKLLLLKAAIFLDYIHYAA